MNAPVSLICVNPVGESKNAPQYPPETWPLDTPGGRYYAEWDDQAHAPSRVGWGALAASMVVPSLRVEFTVRGAHAPSRVGCGALAASMVALPLWVEFTVRASL